MSARARVDRTPGKRPEPPRACAAAPPFSPAGLLEWQRRIGNAATGRLLARIATEFPVRDAHRFKESDDERTAYFDRQRADLDSRDRAKLDTIAGSKPKRLTLRGYASEDEDDRPALVNARIDAVKNAMAAKASSPTEVTHEPYPDAGERQPGYRRMRRVTIVDPDQPTQVQAGTSGQQSVSAFERDKRLEAVRQRAGELLGQSGGADAGAGATKTAVGQLFGMDTPPAEALARLRLMKAQLTEMETRGAFGFEGEGSATGESARAWTTGVGARAKITFGPLLASTQFSLDPWALTLVHELAHATLGIEGRDFAYRGARLFRLLSPQVALRNPDSFASLVATLTGIENTVYGGLTERGAKDDNPMLNPEDHRTLRTMVAWLEQYATAGEQQLGNLYSGLVHPGLASKITREHELVAATAPMLGELDLHGLAYRVALVGLRDRYLEITRFCSHGLAFVEGAPAIDVELDFVYGPAGSAAQPLGKLVADYLALTKPWGAPDRRVNEFVAMTEALGRRKELPAFSALTG